MYLFDPATKFAIFAKLTAVFGDFLFFLEILFRLHGDKGD